MQNRAEILWELPLVAGRALIHSFDIQRGNICHWATTDEEALADFDLLKGATDGQ